MKISRNLLTWISLATLVEAERLSVSKITELFWNKIELPKSPRGVQWHQCGQKPKTPKNAQDVVCNGARCFVICDKGAKRQSRSVTKCQKKKKQFQWSKGGVLNDCAACPELAGNGKISNDLVANCEYRGQWGNKGSFQMSTAMLVTSRNWPQNRWRVVVTVTS